MAVVAAASGAARLHAQPTGDFMPVQGRHRHPRQDPGRLHPRLGDGRVPVGHADRHPERHQRHRRGDRRGDRERRGHLHRGGPAGLRVPDLERRKDWETGAYSPVTNTMYMPLRNTCARMMATRVFPEDAPPAERNESRSELYAIAYRHQLAPGTENAGTVRANSAETGATVSLQEQRAATMSLAATGGGFVFGGDVNGWFRAFSQEIGEVLWEINLGSAVTGCPSTYAVDGAVRGGEHGVGGDVVALHGVDAGVEAECGEQSVRVGAVRFSVERQIARASTTLWL